MKATILFILVSVSWTYAQTTDRTEELQEILLRGNFSATVNPGYTIEILPDSILTSDYLSLGELLQEQSNLYFKQNGYGMVSSISLRGTTASQTGVFWNGIAINSALNGQTDFNTIQGNSFSEVEIRRGGGSVLLGSGAIGGAINLSDRIQFEANDAYQFLAGIGSFSTFNGQATGRISSERLFVKLSLGGYSSQNDYPFLGTALKNENGEIRNYNGNLTLGYKLGERNQISVHASLFNNDRNLSRTLTTIGNEKLENLDTRMLAEWKFLGNRFTSSFKLAFLNEDFRYFFDQDQPENVSEGGSKRWIGKYDLTYFLRQKMLVKAGVEIEDAVGTGSNFSDAQRTDFTGYILFQHRPVNRFVYNLSLRGGGSSAYQVPVIFSVDGALSLSEGFDIRAAYSSNYRLPTFNDLYWEPGGNPDLDPETSRSGELGLVYRSSNHLFSVTGFLISSQDLIQWQPGTGGIWGPVNIAEARNYGLEFRMKGNREFQRHAVNWSLQYDYTRAIDQDLETQLIYVPEHRANASAGYAWNGWRVQYQLQYTGEVFTTTSNSQTLDDYALSNLEFGKSFLKKMMTITLHANNLFDKDYESVAFRPMPGRNFHLNLNLKL